MKWHKRSTAIAVTALVSMGALAACSPSSTDGGDVELAYWLWDSNQQPGYQQCADAFEEANPGIGVTVSQFGWDDYWGSITTGLVSGTAPDVFTDHAAFFPTFVEQGQILPIDDVVESEGIDVDAYQPGLADLWVGADGNRYGLPKDIGLVALFANGEKLAEAGLTEADLQDLTWNPQDGGSYEALIARLSVDANGVRGDEPGFDPSNVATYGLGLNGAGDGSGETIWAQYALSNGWEYYTGDAASPEFQYGDERFLETISWFRSLSEKGYMPTLQIATSGIGQQDNYGAGNYAMVTEGSWSAGGYSALDGITTVIAPLPEGPAGRHSTANSLGDAVAATTEHPEEAKALLAFFGSADCQSLIAEAGVVIPALSSESETALATYEAAGIDIAPFLSIAEAGDTHTTPVVAQWADAMAIYRPTMEAFLGGQAEVDSFIGANDQINALYQ
jgi:multiple sugar transport system substrate-binding protein